MRTKPTKRERIDEWLRKQKVGYRFYARQLGNALNLTTAEVAIYLQWHKLVKNIGDYTTGPNWEIVRGVLG